MRDTEPRARPIAKLAVLAASGTPALVAAVGERASYRFFEFFTANITYGGCEDERRVEE